MSLRALRARHSRVSCFCFLECSMSKFDPSTLETSDNYMYKLIGENPNMQVSLSPTLVGDNHLKVQYPEIRILAKSTTGLLLVATHASEAKVTVKFKHRSYVNNTSRQQHLHEAKILLQLGTHQHIVHANYCFEQYSRVILVMENCHATLRMVSQCPVHFTLPLLYRWIAEILSALAYVHDNGIAHLDVKPENILIMCNNSAKLSNFEKALVICGTPSYDIANIDAEIRPPAHCNPTSADSFSFGMTILTVSAEASGVNELFFLTKYERIIMYDIIHTQEVWKYVPEPLKCLAVQLLELNYKKRIEITRAFQQYGDILLSAQDVSMDDE